MEDLSGKQLGPYRVVAPLGKGGMATVYKAYAPAVDRYVALKILPPAFVQDVWFRHRFEREAELLASFVHPHIRRFPK
jgi:serine/threonine-protein kinase